MRRVQIGRSRVLGLLVWLVAMSACSSDEGRGLPVEETPTPDIVRVADVPSPDAGEVVVKFAGEDPIGLTIVDCMLEPEQETTGEPVLVVRLRAERSDGSPIVFDATRFQTAGAATTTTDTVTLLEGPEEEPDRVLVAQRFEVDGLVTDGREPDANAPILRLRNTAVEGSAVFAPPGNFVDDGGLVAGAFRARCR